MTNLAFSAVLALGMDRSHGAVLVVQAANNDVRQIVMADIKANGDRMFIDLQGLAMPQTGLVRIHAELDRCPAIDNALNYTLLSIETLVIPI